MCTLIQMMRPPLTIVNPVPAVNLEPKLSPLGMGLMKS